MSTTPFPGPYPTTIGHILAHHITTPAKSRQARSADRQRGRPGASQGRALQTLGHAIEYLVGSQPALNSASSQEDREAGRILRRLSHEVFTDFREAVPVARGLRHWLRKLLTAPHAEYPVRMGRPALAGNLLR